MTPEQEKTLEEIFGPRTKEDEYDPYKPRPKPTEEQINALIKLIRHS